MEKKPDNSLEVPFVLTINYAPSFAQINLKGRAYIIGEKGEIEKIFREYEEKKPPPLIIVQSVSNMAFTESVLISKTLNIPPPIPLPQMPENQPVNKTSGKEYTA